MMLHFLLFVVNLGRRHPDPVVESSTLSGVDPPEVRYHLKLPNDVIESGALSSAQLEAVIYACQRHECILPNDQRAGFLIGKIASCRMFGCGIFAILSFLLEIFGLKRLLKLGYVGSPCCSTLG